jgi:hypothetical protein
MKDEIKLSLEKTCSAVIGSSIVKVNYINVLDVNTDTINESRFDGEVIFDTVDFGIELLMGDGKILSVSWDSEVVQYEISVREIPLNRVFNNTSVLDVTKRDYWIPLLNNPIQHIFIYWHVLVYKGINILYPQDLEIIFFTGKRVWIGSRLYTPKEDVLVPFSDEITIIFSEEIARKYHVGSYLEHGQFGSVQKI